MIYIWYITTIMDVIFKIYWCMKYQIDIIDQMLMDIFDISVYYNFYVYIDIKQI